MLVSRSIAFHFTKPELINNVVRKQRELTICFHPFHPHKQSYQQPYHRPRVLSSEQSDWNSQCGTNLLILMGFFHKISPIQSLGHPPKKKEASNTK